MSGLDLQRVLPHAADAERAVLGTLISFPDRIPAAVELLTPAMFYQPAHLRIYQALVDLADAAQLVDMVTLTQRLEDRKELEACGGAAYLAALVMQHGVTSTSIEWHAAIVRDKWFLRELIVTGSEIQGSGYEGQEDVSAALEAAESKIFRLTAQRHGASGFLSTGQLVSDTLATISHALESDGRLIGLPSGYRKLDSLTGGFRPGHLVIVGGRTSHGKTALAMNIVEHLAVDQGLPVGVFSLEMSAEELMTRLLCCRAQVDLRALREGTLEPAEFPRLTTVAADLRKAPLHIDPTPGLTISQLRSRARRLVAQHQVKLLVVDYLQLVRAPSKKADINRTWEVADVSAGLKGLAKELSIPIVVGAQINRDPEKRSDGKPRLADLRESGAIEQDADVVILVHRPPLYKMDAPETQAVFILAKQRNGPTGEVEVEFIKEHTRFINKRIAA